MLCHLAQPLVGLRAGLTAFLGAATAAGSPSAHGTKPRTRPPVERYQPATWSRLAVGPKPPNGKSRQSWTSPESCVSPEALRTAVLQRTCGGVVRRCGSLSHAPDICFYLSISSVSMATPRPYLPLSLSLSPTLTHPLPIFLSS